MTPPPSRSPEQRGRPARWAALLQGVAFTLVLSVVACAPAAAQDPVPAARETSAASGEAPSRLRYVEHYRDLAAGTTLERFAALVQFVVDDHHARFGDELDETTVETRILDTLVDLFVSDEFRDEKLVVMTTAPQIPPGRGIGEPDDYSGFAAPFRAGDGRFRHFAMNAALSYRDPTPGNLLTDFGARLVGRDWESDDGGTSADTRADLATNVVGRAFGDLLAAEPLAALAGGGAVEAFVLERFGSSDPRDSE